MRIISWNLNGLLASMKSEATDALAGREPDVVCLQEIRTRTEPVILEGYRHYWNHGDRDGYAGTAVLMRKKPVCVTNGFLNGFDDDEGRVITVETASLYLVNVYVPNSQQNLKRQAFRLRWDAALREHIELLMRDKPVVVCGDFNVARSELDFYEENLRQQWAQQGYASDERSDLETLLELGLCDAFRERNPDKRSYTWWSNRLNKRRENRGWRLDYFLVSEGLMKRVQDVSHLAGIMGSDHCPIELEVKL